jgi:acetyltransferase-like isoleucine patch superfamily enzyme
MSAPFGQIMEGVILNAPPVNRISRDDVEAINWFPCRVAKTALLEHGVIVQYGDTRPTLIGERVWLGSYVVITHDVQVGDDTEIMHGSVIGGYATIGRDVKIGMQAAVKPRVTIGDRARIGMGAVVTKDVPAGETWVGNPARKHERCSDPTWEEWWDASRAAVHSHSVREWPAAP